MTTSAAEGHDVRQALHRAVRDLFEQNGYAGTHIRDITDEAGVALSTFYATYGSKKQAWDATMGSADETTDSEAPHGRAAQTRAALIAAARDVIERDGYHAARIADIADQAGAAIGSFYHHFSGKQAVFTAVLHDHLATLHNTVGTGRGAAAAIPTTRRCGRPLNCAHTPSSASMLPSIAIWTTTPVTHRCCCCVSTRPLEPTLNSSSCALRYTAISPQRLRPVCAAGKRRALPTRRSTPIMPVTHWQPWWATQRESGGCSAARTTGMLRHET